jgi:hypothetical protein
MRRCGGGDSEKLMATNGEWELEVTVKAVVRHYSGTYKDNVRHAAGGLACVDTPAFSHFNI